MSAVVVDTNVWVLADRITSISADTPDVEADCIEACYRWVQEFAQSDDILVVDSLYRIFKEYRDNVKAGGLAEQELNRLESVSLRRLVYIDVEFDINGHAILPSPISFEDEEDRKFIAVAIGVEPYAPIHNAEDTDWEKERQQLESQGLTIHELCPDYIALKLR